MLEATLDPKTNYYGVTLPAVAGVPSRTVLVSPVKAPGVENPFGLVSPVPVPEGFISLENPNKPINTPTVVIYAVPEEVGFRDFVLIFPSDSGLKPIYVMLSNPLDTGHYTEKQLRQKYKHASDFGVSNTKINTKTLTAFRDALEAHLSDSGTVQKGTYRRIEGSKVHYNPKTHNVVVLDKTGKFVSGWKLDPTTPQYDNYISKGVL